jgi:hypothetical protein
MPLDVAYLNDRSIEGTQLVDFEKKDLPQLSANAGLLGIPPGVVAEILDAELAVGRLIVQRHIATPVTAAESAER